MRHEAGYAIHVFIIIRALACEPSHDPSGIVA